MSKIYGPKGEILISNKITKKPNTREIAVVSIRNQWSSSPSKGLTPERLGRILKEAENGDVFSQSELFEEMEEKDTHLSSIMSTRKNAVLGLDWDVMPYSEDPRDVKKADFIRQAMELEGLEDALLDLLDAIGKGFSVTEIMWKIFNNQVWVDRLKCIHQKHFTFDEEDNLKVSTDDHPMGIYLEPNKFIVHRYKAKSGSTARAGILRVCTWMYMFKNYSIKDWVVFAEVYGMPLRLGKYESGVTKEDKDALIEAIRSLGTDAAGVISKNTEIEFIDAIKGTSNVFHTLATFCNAEMSKAVLGQTLTTEVGTRGSYAASKTHDEVRQDIKEADCKALAETLRRYLIKPLCLFNFGETNRLPWIKFHYEPADDLENTANIYSILIKDIGLPVSQDHVYEKFGVPKPKEGETLIAPPTSTPFQDELEAKSMKRMALKQKRLSSSHQKQIDELADKSLEDALSLIDKLIQPVRDLINTSSSLEEVRDRLAEIYQDMDTDELEDLIARALFAADAFGRWTVNAGNGN
jgi:phage gp29-like protein